MYIREDDLYIKTAPWNLGHGKWCNDDDRVDWLQGLFIPTILPDRELLKSTLEHAHLGPLFLT